MRSLPVFPPRMFTEHGIISPLCSSHPNVQLSILHFWLVEGIELTAKWNRLHQLECLSLSICVISLTVAWMNGICWEAVPDFDCYLKESNLTLPVRSVVQGFLSNLECPWTLNIAWSIWCLTHVPVTWPELSTTDPKWSVKYSHFTDYKFT
jgi:hypothetical protein